jgi:pyruvate/2-oxoglutarate dehydrogenase complex dihydrolipoamide dehydrogenase (E3) component
MVIVGSELLGNEFAYFYATLGTKVTLVNFAKHMFQTRMKRFRNRWNARLKRQELM